MPAAKKQAPLDNWKMPKGMNGKKIAKEFQKAVKQSAKSKKK